MKINYSVNPIIVKVHFTGDHIQIIPPDDLDVFNITDNTGATYKRVNINVWKSSEIRSICDLVFIIRTKIGEIKKYPWHMCKVYSYPLQY